MSAAAMVIILLEKMVPHSPKGWLAVIRIERRSYRAAISSNRTLVSALEQFATLDGPYLLSLDGTGSFRSKKIHCSSCCVTNHRNGTWTSSHHMMDGVIVHPDASIVISRAPEMITRQDGPARTILSATPLGGSSSHSGKTPPPPLRTIVVKDALTSNGPHVEHRRDNNIRVILGLKPGDRGVLFDGGGGRQPSGYADPHHNRTDPEGECNPRVKVVPCCSPERGHHRPWGHLPP